LFDLTVVIPAHNEEARIGGQLAALADERWAGHQWEVVVVDNLSTDRTAEIARHFNGQIPTLRVVPATERAGISYARNTGIAAARSDRIAICDADDIIGEGWVAAMGSALQSHELVTGVLEVDRLNPRWLADTRGRRGPAVSPLFHGYFPIASGGNLGLHRGLWAAIGGFAEHVPGAEDIHFSMEAWRRGIQLHVEPGAVLHYRFRDEAGALWRQGRSYGRARATVCRDLRRYGYAPRRLAGWRSWGWLVVKLPSLVTHRGRVSWAWVAGNRLGQLEGSVGNRSLYL
jgi:glycosyltransferase involved in cell wall biosynthesis